MHLPTLYTQPGSRWWWFSLYTETPDGKKKRIRKSCKGLGLSVSTHTREQALDELQKHFGIKDGPDPGEETLGWLKNYFADRMRRDGLRESTIDNYRYSLDHLVAAKGESTLISDITRADIDTYKAHLLEKGLRHASVNSYLKQLQSIFSTLVDDGVIEINPFARFKPLAEQPRDYYHLNEKFIIDLITTIAADKPSTWTRDPVRFEARKRLVPIYLYTGLRRREVLILRRDQVDLENNRILATNIKHSRRVKRWITIPPSIRTEIEWFLDTFEGPEPFNVCSPDTITHYVKGWMKKADLPEDLHLHSLRHTFATLALRHESVWRIRDHMGHAKVQTTQGYAHTDVDDGKHIDIGVDISDHWGSGNSRI